MSQAVALSMLSQARTLVEREMAIQFAMDQGIPLSDIETYLDRIDAAQQQDSAHNAASQPIPLEDLPQGEHSTSHGEDRASSPESDII